MKRLVILAIAVAACSKNPVAAQSCDAEKRAVYHEAFGGEPDASWLASDVWRLDPVHSVYFAVSDNGCTVTRQGS